MSGPTSCADCLNCISYDDSKEFVCEVSRRSLGTTPPNEVPEHCPLLVEVDDEEYHDY